MMRPDNSELERRLDAIKNSDALTDEEKVRARLNERRRFLLEEKSRVQWVVEEAERMFGPLPEDVRSAFIEELEAADFGDRITRATWKRDLVRHADTFYDAMRGWYEVHGLLSE